VFYVYDESSRLTQWNHNLEILTGRRTDELLGARPQDLVGPEEIPALEAVLEELRATGRAAADLSLLHKDGAVTPLYCCARLLRRQERDYIVGTGFDTTEQRRAEQALRESEASYRAIFNGTREAIFIHDAETGEVIDCNRTVGSMFGLTGAANADLAQPDQAGRYLHGGSDAHVRAAAAGEPQVFEGPVRRRDGSTIWVEGTMQAVELGGHLRIMAVVRDVSEAREAREQLLQADKLASLGTLVAGVAHEINNPNQYIMLSAPTLADLWAEVLPLIEAQCEAEDLERLGGVPVRELAELVPRLTGDILDGSERITSIVASLRDFARQDASPDDEPVDVNAAVEEASNLAGSRIRAATARFSMHLQEGLPPVAGNRQRLEQVIINLLLNACEALGDRQRSVELTTSHDAATGMVVITVRDEGCGMDRAPPFARSRAHRPAVTARPDRDRPISPHVVVPDPKRIRIGAMSGDGALPDPWRIRIRPMSRDGGVSVRSPPPPPGSAPPPLVPPGADRAASSCLDRDCPPPVVAFPP
jgi:PAS domain S-box-containing protein